MERYFLLQLVLLFRTYRTRQFFSGRDDDYRLLFNDLYLLANWIMQVVLIEFKSLEICFGSFIMFVVHFFQKRVLIIIKVDREKFALRSSLEVAAF